MSSGDFNLLHLRNLKMYNPDGSYVSTGYVFTVNTQGTPSYTNSLSLSGMTASSITTSTLNSSAEIGFSTLVGSSLTATSASASSVTVSTLNASAQIGFSTLVGSSLTATSASVSSVTVSTLNASAQIGFSSLVGSSLTATSASVSSFTTSTLSASSLTTSSLSASTLSTSLLTTPDIQLLSTQISLGLSTTSSQINFSEGDYSASSWLTAKSDLTNVRKLGTSASGQYQLVVSGATSDLWLSSDSGITWSSLSPATTGLPVLTGASYWSSGSISASGQYILLAIYGGSLWMSQDFGRTFALTNQPTPDIWLQLNGNTNDAMGGPAATATGSPAYVTVQHPGFSDQAVNLANTAGGTATRYVRGAWAGAPNFTVSFWFNAQTVNGTTQPIFSAYSGGFQFFVHPNSTLYYQFPSGGSLAQITTSFTLTANTWYFVTGIFQSNSTCSLYVNNVLIGSITNVGGLGSFTSSLLSLGTYDTNTTSAFNGYVADLKIHNSAIPYVSIPHLLPNIWLPFENTTADLGSNAITPTVTGSVSYVPGVVGLNAVNLVNTAGETATNYVRGAWTGAPNFTVSFWFNLQSSLAIGYQNMFTSYSAAWAIDMSNDRLELWNGGSKVVSSTLSVNTWYHAVGTFVANGTGELYLNGSRVGTYACGATAGTSSGSFGLGTNDTNTVNAANIYIDDFRIYNAAIPYHVLFPQNYRSVALSGTGQYALASAASGWVLGSTTSGQTWRKQAVCVGTQGDLIQPNKTGLGQAQWEQNGVNWVASASSQYDASYPVHFAFNNVTSTYWASAVGVYNTTTGLYTGGVSTTILGGIGAQSGEWLQIRTSLPVVLSSYTYGSGGSTTCIPKVYYIVGSMDGSSWYPLQYVSMSINPLTTTFTVCTSNIITNTNGTFTITGNVTGSGTSTSYSYTTQPWIYFRFLIPSIWPGIVGANTSDFGELYLNFSRPSATALSLSYSGQYQLVATNSAAGNVMPNQTGLVSSTWVQGGVQWRASASTEYNNGALPSYMAFNNITATSNGWASNNGTYNQTTGAYVGSVSTTVSGGFGNQLGEWLQIQSSVPLVFASYTFAVSDTISRFPKVFYIVGSMDGSTWFPVQAVSLATNPFTTGNTFATTYLNVNTTGTQPLTAGASSTATTTAYSTSTSPYMYFRIIVQNTFTPNDVSITQIGEWYLNFQNSVSYSSNYGSTWLNSSRTLSNEIVSLSPSGQYALSTNSVPPLARLTLDNTAVDAQGVLTPATGAGTVTYSTSIKRVGTHSAFFDNTAGAVAANYLNYTVPSILGTPSALTMACWIYPTSYPSSNNAYFVALPGGTGQANAGSTLYLSTTTGIIGFYSGKTLGGNNFGLSSNIAAPLNAWTHTAITFSGGLVTIYVNGVSQNTVTIAGNLSTDTVGNMTNLLIGCVNGSAQQAFAGYVDDVRLYTQALSADEINSLYQNPALTQSIGVSNSYLPITSYTEPVLPNISANVVDAKVSQTGQYMVAVTSATSNNVYYSIDFGATFNALTIGTSPMTACSMSYDGSYLTVSNATTVYTLNKNSTGYTLAIGSQAGQQNQAENAIAIGNQAGVLNQSANSIILNASGSSLNSTTPGFYVAPIADTAGLPMDLLGYGADSQVVKSGVTVLAGANTTISPNTITLTSNIRDVNSVASVQINSTRVAFNSYNAGYPPNVNPVVRNSIGAYYGTRDGVVSRGAAIDFEDVSINSTFPREIRSGQIKFYAAGVVQQGIDAPLRMIIAPTGNVGIGTTDPSSKLDIFSSDTWQTAGVNINNTTVTDATYQLNVSGSAGWATGGTFGIYNVKAAGFSMVISPSGNVGIGTTNPGSLVQIGAPSDVVYSPNPISNNTVTIFGPARTGPTTAGTNDLNGTLFVNSTSANGVNVGASIALGGRSANFGGGQLHMTYARISGVQSNFDGAFHGEYVVEVQNNGVLYKRFTIDLNGNVYLNAYTTNGTLTTINSIGQLSVSSDRRIKENIHYLSDTQQGLTSVLNLKPAMYSLIGSSGTYLGFIAQDLEVEIPLAVDGKKYEWQWEVDEQGNPKFDSDGNIVYKLDENGNRIVRPRGVQDRAIIATQTLAIQELAKRNDLLQSQLAAMQQQLASTQQQLADKSAKLDALVAWAQPQGFSG
jgi:hypothetical protein